MTENIQGRMATGAVWMVLFKLIERSLGLISTLFLARLLMPADFGIVAMAMSFIAMAEMLAAFGFDIAIIHNQSATTEHYNSAWTGNLLMGGVIAAVTLLMAEPVAHFYGKQELVWVMTALAIGPLLAGCENIGVVAFRKELNFRKEFKFQLIRKLVGVGVVVPLAFMLRSYWALVAGMLVSKMFGSVISYVMHPFRPRPTLSKFAELFRFSRWMLLNNIVAFFKERSSDFFIGRLHGPSGLGLYNVSYEFANLPSTELSAPINRALLPGFARMTSPDAVASAYSNAVRSLALMALPAAAGIFAVAHLLVPVLLGEKWLQAGPLMSLLAFNGALLLFHSSICAVLIARGFPRDVVLVNGVYVLMLVPLLWVFSREYGVIGAAYAVLTSSLLSTPIYLYQVRRCLDIGSMIFIQAIARPLLAAATMALVLRWVLPSYDLTMTFGVTLAWLLLGTSLGIVTYTFATISMWWLAGRPDGPERVLMTRLRELLATRFCGRTRTASSEKKTNWS